ncbi:MAG: hypothetical protein ABWY18_11775, partial [Tardiphaga sp.]
MGQSYPLCGAAGNLADLLIQRVYMLWPDTGIFSSGRNRGCIGGLKTALGKGWSFFLINRFCIM